MSTIYASVSSVGSFAQDTVSQYSQISNLAQAILSSMGQMTAFVEDEKTKLEKQAIQLAQLSETLRIKVVKLIAEIQSVQEYRDRCSDEYHAADEYDDISYWRNQLSAAQKRYNTLSSVYTASQQMQKDILQRQQQFQQLLRALTQMIDALQKNVLEVKKITSALHEEMNYNSQALTAVLNRLEGYCAALPLCVNGSSSSGVFNYSAGGGSGTTRAVKKRKVYKLNKSTFGYDMDGKRHTYKLYIPQAQPMKSILFELMHGLRMDFRDAIMKELEGVEFLSARHGFIYNTSQRGKRLRIIGVDISDPSFNHLLLMHVGHHLYETSQAQERLTIENRISQEMAMRTELADRKMREMAMDFSPVDSVKQNARHTDFRFKSAGSKFFSQCFRAYVAEDYEFLNVVKENFGDSYNAFLEIITKLPNR